MRGLKGIFSRGHEEAGEPPALTVESFQRVHDDGSFCVVQVAVSPAEALDREAMALCARTGAGQTRFMPVTRPKSDDVAEFLLPSDLLSRSALTLEMGDDVLELPEAVGGGGRGLSATDAYLAQQ